MRVLGCTVAAVLTLLVLPAAGVAGWSTPQQISAPGASAMAVNARGQTAIASTPGPNPPGGPTDRTFVAVIVRTAGGRMRTRRVWSSNHAVVLSVSVAIDDRGVVTVAWASARPDHSQGPEPVRAAYGPLSGRWAAARVIGHASSLGGYGAAAQRYPQLAVAPGGEVLLAWDDDAAPQATLLAAWREPGHRFGAPRVVGRSPNTPLGAIPAFDTHGRAYLSSPCYGLVLSAAPRSHRFGAPVLVAPGQPLHQALSFSLALSGAGQGLASWVDGACTGDAAAGDTYGPAYASVLQGGRFGPPIALTPPGTQAFYTNAVAVPGSGMVTWSGAIYSPTSFQSGAFIVQIGADGRLGATQPIADERAALAADGGGDVVFAPPPSIALQPFATPPTPVFVRPAGGGADQPAPASYGGVAVATPVGRAVALLWNTSPTGGGPRLALSVWRP